jgi:hypothetical protein
VGPEKTRRLRLNSHLSMHAPGRTALAAALLVFVFPATVVAATTCDSKSAIICCYSESSLNLESVATSDWWYDWSYRARRKDSAGNITYEHDVACCQNSWTFSNAVDACRRTTLKGNGNPSDGWLFMQQYSIDSNCNC